MAEIRRMTQDELQRQVQWAADEGWEPGVNDAGIFWNLDPEGFLAIEEHGEFLGGGAIIRHSPAFGFMGLFIIDPAHRGRGLGTKLWMTRRDTLLQRLDDNATVALDGVYDMVPFYEKGGFRQFSHHRRFLLDRPAADAQLSRSVKHLKSLSFEEIASLDARCFPGRRDAFLSKWISQPTAISLGYVDGTGLRGFGVMRRCVSGWRVAPLFAESVEIADTLFQAFQLHQGDKPLFLDVPDYNPAAGELCNRYRMQEIFGCVRMYLGSLPQMELHNIFGTTTLEVG